MASDTFSRFVSLACHDLRTPLATISGFAHTLDGMEEIGDPAARYIGIMKSAGEQMGELLDALGLVARIEGGRYEPALVEADSLELAQAAAAKLGAQADAGGTGGRVLVDLEPMESGLAALALCALRHGGLERIEQLPHLLPGRPHDPDVARSRIPDLVHPVERVREPGDGG